MADHNHHDFRVHEVSPAAKYNIPEGLWSFTCVCFNKVEFVSLCSSFRCNSLWTELNNRLNSCMDLPCLLRALVALPCNYCPLTKGESQAIESAENS